MGTTSFVPSVCGGGYQWYEAPGEGVKHQSERSLGREYDAATYFTSTILSALFAYVLTWRTDVQQ